MEVVAVEVARRSFKRLGSVLSDARRPGLVKIGSSWREGRDVVPPPRMLRGEGHFFPAIKRRVNRVD